MSCAQELHEQAQLGHRQPRSAPNTKGGVGAVLTSMRARWIPGGSAQRPSGVGPPMAAALESSGFLDTKTHGGPGP